MLVLCAFLCFRDEMWLAHKSHIGLILSLGRKIVLRLDHVLHIRASRSSSLGTRTPLTRFIDPLIDINFRAHVRHNPSYTRPDRIVVN
jgi:hypothetical protein